METDSTNITNDAGNMDEGQLQQDCQSLKTDAGSTQQTLPTPDAQETADISAALTDYLNAADDCISGINNQDATILTEAANQIDAANAELGKATSRLDQLSGQ